MQIIKRNYLQSIAYKKNKNWLNIKQSKIQSKPVVLNKIHLIFELRQKKKKKKKNAKKYVHILSSSSLSLFYKQIWYYSSWKYVMLYRAKFKTTLYCKKDFYVIYIIHWYKFNCHIVKNLQYFVYWYLKLLLMMSRSCIVFISSEIIHFKKSIFFFT